MTYAAYAKHWNQEQDYRKLLCASIQNADSIYAALKVVVTQVLQPNACPVITDLTEIRKLTLKPKDTNTASVDKKKSSAKAKIMKNVLQVIASTPGVAIA